MNEPNDGNRVIVIRITISIAVIVLLVIPTFLIASYLTGGVITNRKIILITVPVLWIVTTIYTVWDRSLKAWMLRDLWRDGFWWVTTSVTVYVFAVFVIGIDPDTTLWEPLAERVTQRRIVNPREFIPGLDNLKDIYRLDTDSDGFEEWLVFYRYDRPDTEHPYYGRSPIGAAIYDPDRCRPPILRSYELRPYDYDYVAEQQAIPELVDLVGDENPELILKGYSGGLLTDMSIFQWFDLTQGCQAPAPEATGYRLLGTFRATGGIERRDDRIIVKDRGPFERSQLAIREEYEPDATGSYMGPDGKGLAPPAQASIDFTFSRPQDITASYYPEKAVLALYRALEAALQRESTEAEILGEPEVWLTEQARKRYRVGRDSFGAAVPGDQLQSVLVKTIAYYPDVEKERLHKDRCVTVDVAGIGSDGIETRANTVTWVVTAHERRGALPYDCEWRLVCYVMGPAPDACHGEEPAAVLCSYAE